MSERRSSTSDVGVVAQLCAESEAMAKYALASGLRIPASVLQVVAAAEDELMPPLDGGPAPSPHGGEKGRAENIRRVSQVHDQLAQIVAPATPRTLLLLSRDKQEARFRFLGPVRLVRQMMMVAIVLLATFIFTALSPDVNHTSGDIFSSSGWRLLINELFLLSAAGVGAAFTALFRANRYIANGTYDPKYESSYWVRFILGLIAGIVLPALIPVQGSQAVTRPLLALLGGFSASVVYRILSRLVDTLESFVQGDSRELSGVREQVVRAQAAEQRSQDQLRLAAALIKLRDQLDAGLGADQVKATVAHLVDQLTADDAKPPLTEPSPPVEVERPRPVVVS